MKHLFIELYKKITGLNKKIIRNAAEIVSNKLKTHCVVMTKIHNESMISDALAKN